MAVERARLFGSALSQLPIPRPTLVARLIDPEWVILFGCLLGPSVLCVLLGDWDRAAFYARLALYLGFLKWLGWVVLTRGVQMPRAVTVFPAELLAGVTLLVLWFYVRTVIGWLVPGSYSLRELGVAAWLVAIGQLVGSAAWGVAALRRATGERSSAVSALTRSVVYLLPFVVTLTLTLWSVSKEVFVPSQDGWFHSFIARVYLNDGMLFQHFNGGDAIFYVSGFGAMNAVAAAASGLSVVQTHNLQHILWIVTGFYLITTTVALVAGRHLVWLHVAPPLFLTAYPAHNLPPDVFWTHTPQQTASALLVAIPLLSLVLPVHRRVAFYRGMAVQAFLSVIVLALSPVCAFFLPMSCGIAVVLNVARSRAYLAEKMVKSIPVQAAFVGASALLVLGCDRYYSTLLLNPVGASYMQGAHYGGESASRGRVFSFSPGHALQAAAAIKPMLLMPHDPARHEPGRPLPWLALASFLVALVVAQRSGAMPARRRLIVAAATALAAWLIVKFWASFMSGGMTNPSLDALLLQIYLLFMARRLELWLLFIVMGSATAALYLGSRNRAHRLTAHVLVVGSLATLMLWWMPHVRTHLDPRVGNLVPRNIGVAGRITKADIELAAWIERNLTPEKGLVGTAGMPFKMGVSKFLFPIDAAQALSLYGKHYNFCFQVFDPARKYGYDDYTAHIVNYFDADWCVRNDIRFFHVPIAVVYPNHGLARAREVGLLEAVRAVASSAVYAVRPLPWKPELAPGPDKAAGSHEVQWQSDGSGVASGHDPQVLYALERPTFVHAIRFKYTLRNAANVAASAQLFWKTGAQAFVEHERIARLRLEPAAEEQTLTILVHDTLDTFRFDPDNKPCTFTIRDVELLVKPPDTPAQPTGDRMAAGTRERSQ